MERIPTIQSSTGNGKMEDHITRKYVKKLSSKSITNTGKWKLWNTSHATLHKEHSEYGKRPMAMRRNKLK